MKFADDMDGKFKFDWQLTVLLRKSDPKPNPQPITRKRCLRKPKRHLTTRTTGANVGTSTDFLTGSATLATKIDPPPTALIPNPIRLRSDGFPRTSAYYLPEMGTTFEWVSTGIVGLLDATAIDPVPAFGTAVITYDPTRANRTRIDTICRHQVGKPYAKNKRFASSTSNCYAEWTHQYNSP
jgi:hypothetical protein